MDEEADSDIPEGEANRVHSASLLLKLRALGITDRAVLRAIETVPRGQFVAPEWRAHAYEDRALPIACGQTLSPPSLIGLITQALDLSDRHSVLDVGTGSGYHAAVISRIARRVTSLDRFRTLVQAAERRWVGLGIRNITGVVADGRLGWPRQAPFDRILVTAAAEEVPVKLVSQLTDSGILIVPIGPADGEQRLTLFQRIGQNVDTNDLGPVRFGRLETEIAQVL
jgi:protein-L-isoaspartate(D-aspartate) O-methyltransferase